jgi:zinc finger CCHC domain-containing protein 8
LVNTSSIHRKYKATIKKFLKELIAQHDCESEADTSDLELNVWEEENEDSEDHVNDDSDLYMVDTHPTIKDDLEVPTYSQKFGEILQKAEDSAETNQNDGTSSPACFNCQGSHNLRDCPLPIDQSVVSKNRREFCAKFGFARNKTSRYHLEDGNRFAEFVPGQISAKLRKALGLPGYRLPRHIYKMRTLGYPPGWLEDARISHSGLALYDSEGRKVAEPNVEEGEIIAEGSRDEYDVTKIISYPGFNVPCSADIADDSAYYNCPPMACEQSKELMLSHLRQNSVRAYKRRRMGPSPAVTTKSYDQDLTKADMEVEEMSENAVTLLPADDNCRFIPPLPKETPPRAPPPPSGESDSGLEKSHSHGIESPLCTGRSGISSPREQSTLPLDEETGKQLMVSQLKDDESFSGIEQKAGFSTPRSSISTLGQVKSVDLGTPILQHASPYTCLPNPEKFSHDICDVINFENLPDSTGKYKKMSKLIHKVRTVVTRIQQEEDDYEGGGQ